MLSYAFALGSAFLGSAKDLLSKRLSFSLSGYSSGLASFCYALPFYALAYSGVLLLGWETPCTSIRFWLLVLARSATDACAEWLKMSSLALTDISLVAGFLAMSPLFLLGLSPLITGDWPSWTGALGVAVAVAGSLLTLHGENRAARSPAGKGVCLALLASLFFALNSCFDRLAVLEAGPVGSGFAMTAAAALLLLPLQRGKKLGWSGLQSLLLLRGALEISFMIAKLSALQTLQAPYVAAFQKLALLLSVALGGRLFGEKQTGRRTAGASLILLGALLIVLSP